MIYKGESFMVANPFTKVLGFPNCNRTLKYHVSQQNQCRFNDIDPTGKVYQISIHFLTKCINLKGIYELIENSKTSKAKAFRLWVIKKLLTHIKEPVNDYHSWMAENSEVIKELKESYNIGYVYAATTKHLKARRIFKISMTTNLNKCINELNSESADDFFYTDVFSTAHFIELEKFLHCKFAKQNYRREFFILCNEDLNDLLYICSAFVQNKNLLL